MLSFLTSPAFALVLGVTLALCFGNPWSAWTKKASKTLLQICVVFLGFNMDLARVWEAGSRGFFFALVSISVTFAIGMSLARKWGVARGVAVLISAGTAICGGSAIAAVAATTQAKDEEISVSAGVIFLLNAVALILFPLIGRLSNLSPHDFGIWAGIAIHDVSSVAGAAAAYGAEALEVAMPVKLSRVLWIAPIAILAGRALAPKSGFKGKRPPLLPPFILLFIVAAALRSFFPQIEPVAVVLGQLAKFGFTITLFLIGSGMTLSALKSVGWRPLILACVLWFTISTATWVLIKTSPNIL